MLSSAPLEGDAIESRQGWTAIVAPIRDEPDFYGLLDRPQDLALHIVSINELGASVMRGASESE